MTANMGTVDRVIRAIVGAVLLVLALGGWIATGWIYTVAVIVGVVMLATAALSNCPAYSLLGIRTCSR